MSGLSVGAAMSLIQYSSSFVLPQTVCALLSNYQIHKNRNNVFNIMFLMNCLTAFRPKSLVYCGNTRRTDNERLDPIVA